MLVSVALFDVGAEHYLLLPRFLGLPGRGGPAGVPAAAVGNYSWLLSKAPVALPWVPSAGGSGVAGWLLVAHHFVGGSFRMTRLAERRRIEVGTTLEVPVALLLFHGPPHRHRAGVVALSQH